LLVARAAGRAAPQVPAADALAVHDLRVALRRWSSFSALRLRVLLRSLLGRMMSLFHFVGVAPKENAALFVILSTARGLSSPHLRTE
jgi:hypothetical protein